MRSFISKFLLLGSLFFSLSLFSQKEKAFEVYGEGVRAFYAQEYDLAIEKYNTALELHPNMIPALFNRGLTFSKQNKVDLASYDFIRVIALDSNYVEAYYQLGKLEMDRKEYDKAYKHLRAGLLISPFHNKSLHLMGVLFFYQRKYKEANLIYNQLIEQDSKDDMAYYKRGICYYNLMDFETAIKDFTKAIELNENNSSAIEQRAESYLSLNKLDDACKDFQTLLMMKVPRAQDYILRYCTK